MAGDPPKPEFIRGFHASGHLSQNDLVRVIDEIDPDTAVPIHTTNKQWFKEHYDNAAEVENGQTISLS